MIQLTKKPKSIQTWHDTSADISAYVKHIEKCLRGELTKNSEEYLKTILTFATVFMGLGNEAHLKAFFEGLISKELKINKESDKFFVELCYENDSHPKNIETYQGDSVRKLSYIKRYLDPQTMIAVSSFLARRKTKASKPIDFNKTIRKLYSQVTGKSRVAFSRQKFLSQLFLAGQLMFRSETPEFLWPVITGEVFCASTESDSPYYSPFVHQVSKNNYPINAATNSSVMNQVISPDTKLSDKSLASDSAIIKRVLNICEAETRHLNREKTLKRILHECNSLFKKSKPSEISLPAFILLDFILDGLSKVYESGNYRWDVGKGTAVKYLNMLYEDWFSLFQSTSITEFDEADFEDLYEILLTTIYENKNKAIKDLLPLFFEFIAHNYSDQVAMPEFLIEENGVSFVRSRVIDESLFQNSLARLLSDSKNRTAHFRRSLEVLYTLIYRLGLRPKEAYNLKLKNISFGSVCEIEIHRNKTSGKSISANRRVEASLFLHDDELQKLKQLHDIRSHITKNDNALLFSQESHNDQAFNYDVLNKPVTEILSEVAGYRVVFYQCRHTAVTNLVLTCFAKHEDVKKHTSYSDYQIEKIKNKFFINRDIVLDQISAFFGHLIPSTTLNSYTHRIELCMLAYQKNLLQTLGIKALSRISKISMKRLKQEFNVKSNERILIDENKLHDYVGKMFKKYLSIKPKPEKALDQNDKALKPIKHWQKTEPNIEMTIQVGELLEQQKKASQIASCMLLETSFVERVKEEIIILKKEGFKATKAETSQSLDGVDIEKCIVPFMKSQERDAIISTSSKLLSFCNHKDYKQVSKRFLSASPNHSYILFSDVFELIETIKLLLKVCEPSNLLVRFDIASNRDASGKIHKLGRLIPENNIRETGDFVHNDKFQHGRFYLHYQNEVANEYVESNENWQKYSSSVVRSSFYWVEVFKRSHGLARTQDTHSISKKITQLSLF